MVVDSKWDNIKETCSKKGKNAYVMVLANRFWGGVDSCLKVFELLVKLLRLVDRDVKPSMSFVYGQLLEAKNDIKKASKDDQNVHKPIIAIMDKKMRESFDAPLHLTAYLLNPFYNYLNPAIFDDPNVTAALITCVEQFYHGDEDLHNEVTNIDFTTFQRREELFGKNIAMAGLKFDYNLGLHFLPHCFLVILIISFTNLGILILLSVAWWKIYGGEAKHL
ncbi:hypothetical protein LINGRAHAP2_LOCUS24582 [Linum grandiflorum]